MNKLLLSLLLASSAVIAQPYNRVSDEQIRYQIIQQSISHYPGPCACPYSVARNGSQCGSRSAYSKPGGRDPICYPQQIPDYLVQDYRRRTGQ